MTTPSSLRSQPPTAALRPLRSGRALAWAWRPPARGRQRWPEPAV